MDSKGLNMPKTTLQLFVAAYKVIQMRNKRIKKLIDKNAPKLFIGNERIQKKAIVADIKRLFKKLLQEIEE